MTNNYTIREANEKEMHEICRLRYDSYIRSGLLTSTNSDRKIQDFYDRQKDISTVFVATNAGGIVGTVRLILDSDKGLPIDDEEAMSSFLKPFRCQNRKVSEVCKFAFLPNCNNRRLLVVFFFARY